MFPYRTIFKNIIFSLILICGYATLHAQEFGRQEIGRTEPTWWFGAAGAANFNFYRGTTQVLNSSLTTGSPFHHGFGAGFYAALLAEYRPDPVWGGMLYVGYDDRRGSFDDIISYNCPASLSTTISYLAIEPSLRIGSRTSGFYVFAGPKVSFNSSKAFTFIQDGNPGFKTKGNFSDIHSTVFSGQVGVGYDISLTPRSTKTQINLSPFISFHPYFGQDPRSIETWNITTLRVGAALKFGSGQAIRLEVLPPVVEQDVQFTVRAPKIVPVKRRVRETFPLRNYIFFDEGSSEIPNRYVMLTKNEATSFKEEQLSDVQPKNMIGRSGRQMNVYYNKLNILGDRMRINPDATVTLIGASAQGPDDGRALAESIKRYLVEVFGIDGARIMIEGRDKPKIPSEQPGGTLELKLLRAEDRRVDIETESPKLLIESGGPDMLSPVQIAAMQEDPLDSHVIFYVIGAREVLSSWSLEIMDELGNVQRFGPSTREWESIAGNSILGKRSEGQFKIVMLGQTKRGDHAVRKEGPVINLIRLEEPKAEGLRFSILYRFDKSNMIALYEKFLTDKVVPLIPDSSTVVIHGHTDIIGDEEYNTTLSHNRALDVLGVLESALSNADKNGVMFETFGFGSDFRFAPFDNNLPEERCYNRTVIIDIVPAK